MACFEKRVLEHALALNQGNMTKTAKMLGVSRSTLYEKCRRYDLATPKSLQLVPSNRTASFVRKSEHVRDSAQSKMLQFGNGYSLLGICCLQ